MIVVLPRFDGDQICLMVQFLKSLWTEVVQGGMATLAIVPDFDERKDCLASLGACRETVDNAFGFQRRKETLHHGIVITIASAAHADGDIISLQQGQVIVTGVLTATI